ncbi:hypothetical protein [Microbacterium sp. A1-JK]|uniref:hypothetical protein n=1 Tax=Microbacterium sp. A1-JK TaxID=3177516 RepID=UPI0038845EB3
MADAPEIVLNRALAQLLDSAGMAVYQPTGTIPEKGIRLDGIMPTGVNEFTLLTSLDPVAEGRADMIWRVQVYTRRIGTVNTVRQWASDLRALLDQKEYTPALLGISWSWRFSGLTFERDTQGRTAVAETYYFRGRRP